jgi:hypothetical protein
MKYSRSIADTKKKYARSLAYRKIIVRKCEICGSDRNVERHHLNYNEPLNIKAWCQPCHARKHAEHRQLMKAIRENMRRRGYPKSN